MGYRGKLAEQQRARELRAQAWTLQDIAIELDVSKSSVSLWVRDVEFTPRQRERSAAQRRGPSVLQQRKQAEIDEGRRVGAAVLGALSERDLLVAGIALYAGEGTKTDGSVGLANTSPAMIQLFCRWLRTCFDIDEARLRARLYLHHGLDLAASTTFWSQVTRIPATQFTRPYRAIDDTTRRHTKHVHGCLTVRYACSKTHRQVMGMVAAMMDDSPSAP